MIRNFQNEFCMKYGLLCLLKTTANFYDIKKKCCYFFNAFFLNPWSLVIGDEQMLDEAIQNPVLELE